MTLPKSINLGPSNLKMTVPAVTLAVLRGFAGLDKFGRWRPSIRGYGPRATVEERDAYYAKLWPLVDQSMMIVNSWYMRPVFYLVVYVVRPMCLSVAAIRDARARRKLRKIEDALPCPTNENK